MEVPTLGENESVYLIVLVYSLHICIHFHRSSIFNFISINQQHYMCFYPALNSCLVNFTLKFCPIYLNDLRYTDEHNIEYWQLSKK